ncbi:sigma-54-dependent transcriptional regulator [Anaeromyxobacter paludicola]|uniref:Acetoacetate metabolism regulatory protein AtoC n=1 Tax=Anaeromyxobacter paludicola TaxID=2918171 RepID=A0ABM7XF72_9BACT|nr:sigma-54 dependent transcriptional regulator [Anaeromyxobacter paludicola]BDG10549.1 acetoacetate metabolism regulatory protein AtoC [Anaeromyxobacter paludicola]
MSERPLVLVADDDPGVRYTLRELLETLGAEVAEAADGEEALRRFEARPPALLVTDLRMPGMDGLALLRRVRERSPAARVVVVTAHGSERQAVEAMKAGAFDYFRKPFETEELLAVARRALEAARLAAENERLAAELALSRTMVFASPAMTRLAGLVARVAPRDVNVLITGESGTGKERVAEAIVRASRRAAAPLVRFNCAALTPELAEAELFGHARGAFTGAVRARPGLFGEADGGTLLLDEVGELAPSSQGKLLRVLQDGEVRPVGEERARRVDVRVLAATHRDLAAEVARGAFRQDLYYRLKVVELRVPPLRERPEDVPLLARHFLARYAARFGVPSPPPSEGLLARLAAWTWPGNVRELENAVESLVALSRDGELDPSLLPGGPVGAARPPLGLRERVEAYERGLLVEALRAARGNQSEAARALGLPRVTLHDKLRRLGLAADGEGEG